MKKTDSVIGLGDGSTQISAQFHKSFLGSMVATR